MEPRDVTGPIRKERRSIGFFIKMKKVVGSVGESFLSLGHLRRAIKGCHPCSSIERTIPSNSKISNVMANSLGSAGKARLNRLHLDKGNVSDQRCCAM